MTDLITLYSSENGDVWQLVRDTPQGPIVRHRANPASGGQVTDIGVEEFLQRDGAGPEYTAVRRFLSTLTVSKERASTTD